MCEETPAVVYCVGYVLPVACCMAGACMSCYGCYRYYRANEARRRRLERLQRDGAGFPEVFPRIKRDTLKRKMLKAFTRSVSAKKEKDASAVASINEQVLKDMEDACPICMDSYDDEPSAIFVGLVKKCGHYFHFECLWNWLELNQTCPICRVTCDLAESDLQGLSLKQVLELVKPNDVSVPSRLFNVTTGQASTSRLDDVSFHDAPLQRGADSGTSRAHNTSLDGSSTGSVRVRSDVTAAGAARSAVITTQPHPVTHSGESSVSSDDVSTAMTPRRRSWLVEVMRRRFEADATGDVTPGDDCDSNVRDIDANGDTEVTSAYARSGSRHDN